MSGRSKTVSRRRALSGGLAASALLATQSSGQAPGKPKVLALVGDRYHNPDYIRVGMDKIFGALQLNADYTIQYLSLSRELLKNYQLLLILRDGMIWPDG